MNIYYTEADARNCALAYCDRHLIFEILQMAKALSTAHYVYNSKFKLRLYKAYHNVRHPITHWVICNDKNYLWTYQLFTSLLSEYKYRYERSHRSNKLCKMLKNLPRRIPLVLTNSPRPQAIPHRYHVKGDPITAYRGYYHYNVKDKEKWTHREPPEWIHEAYGDEILPNLHHRPRPIGTSSYTCTTTATSTAYVYTDYTV